MATNTPDLQVGDLVRLAKGGGQQMMVCDVLNDIVLVYWQEPDGSSRFEEVPREELVLADTHEELPMAMETVLAHLGL